MKRSWSDGKEGLTGVIDRNLEFVGESGVQSVASRCDSNSGREEKACKGRHDEGQETHDE